MDSLEIDGILEIRCLGFIGYTFLLFVNGAVCLAIAYGLMAAKRWVVRLLIPVNSLYLFFFVGVGAGSAIATGLRLAEIVVISMLIGFLVGVPAVCLSPSGKRALSE